MLQISSPTTSLASSIKAHRVTVDASKVLLLGGNTLTLTASSTPLVANGTINFATSTVVFVPDDTSGVNVPALNYYNLQLNKTGNTFTFASGSPTIGNNLTISAGTADLVTSDPTVTVTGTLTNAGTLSASDSSNLILKGNFANTGTFTHNNGTVVVTHATTSSFTGTTTFYSLNANAPGKTLQFGANQTFTVAGTLTLTGTDGSPLNIQSDLAGTSWKINLTNNVSLNYLFV